jgi:hypothetical protein
VDTAIHRGADGGPDGYSAAGQSVVNLSEPVAIGLPSVRFCRPGAVAKLAPIVPALARFCPRSSIQGFPKAGARMALIAAVVIPMMGTIFSLMYRHRVGAGFFLANSQHSADPAQNPTCYPAHSPPTKPLTPLGSILAAFVTSDRTRCHADAIGPLRR